MAITRLSLSDFRNHADALIVADQPMIALAGDNGAGKTNLLEAISLLAPGRGLRGAALATMARQGGAGGFGVAAHIGGHSVGTGVDAATPDRRQARLNGAAIAANGLSDILAVLWLTPAMDRLFLDSPGGRRRFLDRLVLAMEPGHAREAARYEAAMRARNALLSGTRGPVDAGWLSALEGQMASHGAAIARARQALVVQLDRALKDAPDDVFARPLLALDGWNGEADALSDALAAGRRADAAAGRTMTGPHRTDLLVTHAAKGQAAALCSTGEQKAMLLAIVLAHAALVGDAAQRPLVLLLDEVAAHLDPGRRHALFTRLRASGAQVWMTGTEASLFADAPDALRLNVADGFVSRTG